MDAALASDWFLNRRIKRILATAKLTTPLETVAAKHAFLETALATILNYARAQGGVMASSEFLWLKPTNRNLWYVCNNVGRRAFHPEASGAMAHWKAERLAKKPIFDPHVDQGVGALVEKVLETSYRRF
jgi:intracellular multiplication protein IcmP